jgi:hypothetical protein
MGVLSCDLGDRIQTRDSFEEATSVTVIWFQDNCPQLFRPQAKQGVFQSDND